jgi:hypothetical protein
MLNAKTIEGWIEHKYASPTILLQTAEVDPFVKSRLRRIDQSVKLLASRRIVEGTSDESEQYASCP